MCSDLVAVVLSMVSMTNGANILFATDILSPSHKIFNFVLIEGLIKRGHNVTFLHPPVILEMGEGLKNYHPIYLEGMDEYPDMEPEKFAAGSVSDMMHLFYNYINFCCRTATESPGLQILLEYPKDFMFDLILFDNTNSNCLLPLIQRFNYPPTIAVTSFLLPYYMSLAFGNALYPSYLPFFGVKYTDNMDFFQRVANYYWTNLDLILRYILVDIPVESFARAKFGPEMTPLSVLEEHVSMLFCNLDPVYHYPQPLPPNIIPVGGMHVRPPRPLPKDLKEIADSAKSGLILFALGTNIRADKFCPEKLEAILDALGKIKLTVIWKFESNLTEYPVPDNVHIREWVPQSDILAHPNTKLFISHAGALSTIEAMHYGIPVLGIPFIVDQYVNILMIEQKNVGIHLGYYDITSESLMAAMNEILSNTRYSKAMKDASRKMRDQPQTPLERAIFWSEFAMRHNGTHFLDPRSRSSSRFVSTSTDVQCFFLFISILICILIVILIHIFLKSSLRTHVKEKTY